MADILYKLTPLNLCHKGNHIFFTRDGELLYGKDENNLIYPLSLEMQGKFPPILTEDLRQAFKLGMKVGKEKQ